MNWQPWKIWTQDANPIVRYYDSDYPTLHAQYKNYNAGPFYFRQGIADDVPRVLHLLQDINGNEILELGCGSGRAAIQFANAGYRVCGVDPSGEMLAKLKKNSDEFLTKTANHIEIFHMSIENISEINRYFDAVICLFNTLYCFADRETQKKAIFQALLHLKPGGFIILDCENPFEAVRSTYHSPTALFTRTTTDDDAHVYTLFAARSELDAEQRQYFHGWYDAIRDGQVMREMYGFAWRLMFPYEIACHLESAGASNVQFYGDREQEVFSSRSSRLIIRAQYDGK